MRKVKDGFLSEKYLEEFHTYCTNFILRHFASLNKIYKLRSVMVKQLGEIVFEYLRRKKVKITENQIGIGVNDEGIEIRCHINKKSNQEYVILKVGLLGQIRVIRENDHLNLIDILMPLMESLFKVPKVKTKPQKKQ